MIEAKETILKTKKSQGSIDCPVCKTGRLNFIVVLSNGHTHAKCTTQHCLQWME